MEPITFKQCFKGAWIDGFNALRNRPLLSVMIAVIVLVSSALGVSLKQLALTAAQSGEPTGFRLRLALLTLVVALLNICALSILAVHVLRYVILGPEAARQSPWLGRDVWRYLWLSLQIVVGMSIVAFVAAFLVSFIFAFTMRASGKTGSYALLATLFVLGMCAFLFVVIRISLIYAQVAVGRSKRWAAAWHDSRGHFWSMYGTVLATVAPLFGVGVIVTLIFGFTLKLMPETMYAVLGSLILKTILSIVWIAVACAVTGWLYHRYADRLLTLEDAPDDL